MVKKKHKVLTKKAAERIAAEYPEASIDALVYEAFLRFKPHHDNIPRWKRRAFDVFREVAPDRPQEPLGGAVAGETEKSEPVVLGTIEAPEDFRERAFGDTFVFTCAQANTHLNDKFWASLMRLVEDKGASLHISRFTYNKQSYGHKAVKPGTKQQSDADDLWFDPRIEPYVSDQSLQIADDLVWCGELNILPTAVHPLNGFDNYGRGSSVIIPHVKMAMRSVPVMKGKDPRFLYSTGTVTARNYIEKAAGQKASLHHVYGALLVEKDSTGTWWARQLNADNDGNVYDLTTLYTPDTIFNQVDVHGIVHGDLHGNKMNIGVIRSMAKVVDILRPGHQVFHDTVDFQARNHHNIKDPHFLHDMRVKGLDDIRREFEYTASHLVGYLERIGCKHHIVTSNHDQAIERWLRDVSGHSDPINMELWHYLNWEGAQDRKAKRTPRPFMRLLQDCLTEHQTDVQWNFVHEDDSLMIAGIQHGLHGHLGPNGARGSPQNLRSAGKANTAHTHSAGIVDGVYTAGVFGNLDMGYNKGLSSWSHSFIITYRNGKRSIVTLRGAGGMYKAWRD